MNKLNIDPYRITERLTLFNYKYKLEGTTVTVFLSMLCCLKIKFTLEKVKMTPHILWRPSVFSRLEYCFFLYGLSAFFFAWLLPELNILVFYFFIFILLYFIVCFIIIENMKSIIHNWIEIDNKVIS
jgi:hypothetical protein